MIDEAERLRCRLSSEKSAHALIKMELDQSSDQFNLCRVQMEQLEEQLTSESAKRLQAEARQKTLQLQASR